MPEQHDRVGFVGQGVPGEGVLELGDDADLARAQGLDRLLGLALQPADVADALLDAAGGVEHLAVRLEGARVDAEDGELAHVGIGDGLEDEGREGRLGIGRAGGRRLALEVGALDGAEVGGGRKLLDEEIHEGLHADEPGSGGGEHGHEGAARDGLAQRAQHLRLGDGALLEVLREEVVVRLRGGLGQLLAPLLRGVHRVRGNLGLARLPVRDEEGLHLDEVHHALEGRLAPDGDLQRTEPPLEPPLERLQGAEEVGALAVHPVDHHDARNAVVVGHLPDFLGLDLHPRHRVHHHHRRAHRAEPRPRVGDEVAVSGRVDEVESVPLVVAERDRGGQRDLALDLVRVEVGGGGAVVHATEAVHRPGGEQHPLDQRRLADAAVADNADVADLRDVERHVRLPVISTRQMARRKKEEG